MAEGQLRQSLMLKPDSPRAAHFQPFRDLSTADTYPSVGISNLLMIGPPGAGKSLLASCLPGILPDLTAAEALEVSMVQSVAGLLEGGRISRTRPFRAPHHSASMAALTGGGLKVKPGEVSLAHLGVLFLDELPEFHGMAELLHQI